ncbi:MAG: carbohydrate kinase family protein [Gemmatimonadales bacterium]|nr:carbohydrate kinase family protein [Gemmatimonadales bacterium]
MRKRLGVLGTLVWDEIHGRTPGTGVEHEWGGIAYALAGLDAELTDEWEIVPLVKVGRDRAAAARDLLAPLRHRAAAARFVECDAPTTGVTLYYAHGERTCGGRTGGTPPWTWVELGPMVADLDALYLNFSTGDELALETALALRHAFAGPIYADLHSLVVDDALRPRAPEIPSWFRCFDVVQVNEAEMARLSPDPLALAARVLAEGAALLLVTVGERGAVYVAQPGFDGWPAGRPPTGRVARLLAEGQPLRTARLAPPAAEVVDTTGCGDVFGATAWAHLLDGSSIEGAVREANRCAARTAGFRGAAGLAVHLRGALLGTALA